MDNQSIDLTQALPVPAPKTRHRLNQAGAIGMLAFGAFLLISDKVERFRGKKRVKVVVEDAPSSNENPSA